ncbi:MAG: hypothetical protein IT428_02355 [Planctomycetaceae bacterium]|nr:hypothetical protein [Planctomycetaceae bacterium]
MARTLNSTPERLAQCAAFEYILLGDLRDLLEEPRDATTYRWLVAVLDALIDTVPKDFAMRSMGGYLEEVIERFPNWYDQVKALLDEQRALFDKLRLMRQSLKSNESFDGLAEDVSSSLREWMNRFIAHQRHERRLVMAAFTMECGAGD